MRIEVYRACAFDDAPNIVYSALRTHGLSWELEAHRSGQR
jgi:hypothetical protein